MENLPTTACGRSKHQQGEPIFYAAICPCTFMLNHYPCGIVGRTRAFFRLDHCRLADSVQHDSESCGSTSLRDVRFESLNRCSTCFARIKPQAAFDQLFYTVFFYFPLFDLNRRYLRATVTAQSAVTGKVCRFACKCEAWLHKANLQHSEAM